MKVPQDELIEYARVYFRERGYKKVAKRWTKETDQFKLVFFIQGSCYDKEDYYVRPSVIIKALESKFNISYGHFTKEIPVVSLKQIVEDVEKFFSKWTDIEFIKERMQELTHCFDVGKRRMKFFKENDNVWIMPEKQLVQSILEENILG